VEGSPIGTYDLLMLIVLVGATVFGAWKGMAWQLASLASVVVSAVVAMQFGASLAPYMSGHEPWNRFIAMLVLYLATSLAIWMGFRLVAGAIDRVRLKEFDHQIGAVFGLVKGALLCLVVTFFVVTLSESGRQAVLKSTSGKYIAVAIQKGTPLMPEELRNVLGKYIEELDRKLDPKTPADAPADSPAGDLERRLRELEK
jgi:membrane protein required for colicin V production